MLYPLVLIDDVKKCTEWVPRVYKSGVLHEHSDTRRVIHIETQFPWPLANRELVICGSAVLCKERQGVLTMLRSYSDERQRLWNISNVHDETNQIIRIDM